MYKDKKIRRRNGTIYNWDFRDKGLCSVENDPHARVVGNGGVRNKTKQRNFVF